MDSSFTDLMDKSLKELQSYCKERGLDTSSRTKIKLAARLLPYVRDRGDIEDLEHHEILSICQELSVAGSNYNERLQNLKKKLDIPESTTDVENIALNLSNLSMEDLSQSYDEDKGNKDEGLQEATLELDEHQSLQSADTVNTPLFRLVKKDNFIERREKRLVYMDKMNWDNINHGNTFN